MHPNESNFLIMEYQANNSNIQFTKSFQLRITYYIIGIYVVFVGLSKLLPIIDLIVLYIILSIIFCCIGSFIITKSNNSIDNSKKRMERIRNYSKEMKNIDKFVPKKTFSHIIDKIWIGVLILSTIIEIITIILVYYKSIDP